MNDFCFVILVLGVILAPVLFFYSCILFCLKLSRRKGSYRFDTENTAQGEIQAQTDAETRTGRRILARRIQASDYIVADIQRLAAIRISGTANSYRYFPSNPMRNPNPTRNPNLTLSHQIDAEAAIQQAEATRISGTVDSYRYQPNPDTDLPPTYNTLTVDNETQQPPPYSLLKF